MLASRKAGFVRARRVNREEILCVFCELCERLKEKQFATFLAPGIAMQVALINNTGIPLHVNISEAAVVLIKENGEIFPAAGLHMNGRCHTQFTG